MATQQKKLVGFTEIEDDEIEELGENYVRERDSRMGQTKLEVEAKGKLLAAIKKNEKIVKAAKANPKGKVKVGDLVITFRSVTSEEVKVKKLSDAEEEE